VNALLLLLLLLLLAACILSGRNHEAFLNPVLNPPHLLVEGETNVRSGRKWWVFIQGHIQGEAGEM